MALVAAFMEHGAFPDPEEITTTHETLDDFREARRVHWAEPGQVIADTATAFVVLATRVAPSAPLRDLYVIDLGDVRKAYVD